jgi:DNA-binding YbaB/EbfC family protein
VKLPGNMQQMMRQAQQMQEKMQQEIAALEVEGTAGGGMVKVTMDGSKNVKRLVIDPEVVSKDEVEMLQDLVTAAFGDCARKVDEALQEKLGGMAGGMKIPGLF